MISKKEIIDVLIREVNRQVNDSYARGEMYKDPQEVSIHRIKLINAFKDAYEKLFEASSQDRNGGELPEPIVLEQAGVFKEAAREAMATINKIIDTGRGGNRRKAGSPKNSNYAIFLQEHKTADGKRKIFTRVKSIAIKHINKFLSLKNIKNLSTTGQLIDRGKDRSQALQDSEDVYFRRFVHREHLGKTVTGTATISARIQMYDRLVNGAAENLFTTKKSRYLTDVIGDILTTYETTLTKGGLTQVKAKQPIQLSVGSYKLNAAGAKPRDIKRLGPIFDKHVRKVLSGMSLDELEALGDIPAIHQHVANLITETIGVRVDGATYSKSKIAAISKARRENKQKTQSDKVLVPTEKRVKGGTISKSDYSSWSEESIREAAFLKLELNKRLRAQVAENMVAPRLVYRTGRFAHSVLVTDVRITPKERIPSIEYTYMLYPYQVFQTGHMYTPQRDPTKLIEKSIREIAAEMMITKLAIRRPK